MKLDSKSIQLNTKLEKSRDGYSLRYLISQHGSYFMLYLITFLL